MRVSPIISNLYTSVKDYSVNRRVDSTMYTTPVYTTTIDTFSFQGKKINPIKTAKEFKKLAIKHGIHCMYCGVPMKYDEKMFNEWKKANLFSAPIGEFVRNFRPYKRCLHDTEQSIFSFVEYVAKENPKAKLDTVIKMMSVNANSELLKMQTPIFEAIVVEAEKLPKEKADKIIDLVEKSKKRMLHIPYIEEFSGKEISYKIMNLAKTLPDDKMVKKIMKWAELLTIPSIKKEEEPVTEKVVRRVLRTLEPEIKIGKTDKLLPKYSRSKLRHTILDYIADLVKDLKRKDILNLCLNGKKLIDGEPVMYKFTNKAFLYDLNEILEGMEGDPIRAKMFELANGLPTSKDNIYALITKHDQSSPEKIAYDLFTPSEVTVEHMNPRSEGGPDSIFNYGMACKRCNNTRQSSDMSVFYKQFNPENAQKYWDEIIREANAGYFEFNDVVEMMRIFQRQSKIKIQSRHLKYKKS